MSDEPQRFPAEKNAAEKNAAADKKATAGTGAMPAPLSNAEPDDPLLAAIAEGGDQVDQIVDEELANLPGPPPKRRSPIASLLVIGVATLLLSHLWPDLRFALGPKSPLALGDARTIAQSMVSGSGGVPVAGALKDNTFVAITGAPDYRNALLFEPRGDSYRRAFYRLLGTQSRLWVRAEQTATRHDLTGPTVGRLRSFDAIPYVDQVRAYYETQVKVQRLLDLDELKTQLARGGDLAGRGPVHDRGGEVIDGSEGGNVDVVLDFPDELLVTLPRDRFAVEEDAHRELSRLGAAVGPVKETPSGFTFPVRFAAPPAPGTPSEMARRAVEQSRNAFIAKLDEKGWTFKLRRERYATALSSLAPGSLPGTLSLPASPAHPPIYELVNELAGPTELRPRPATARLDLPWDRIDSIQLASPIRIPHDAFIVVESELPGDFLYAPLLAGMLLLFIAFNLWLLLRSRRGR